ncbi:MAG: hypothetical protein HY730_04610 [Candidatus Tectomicrobia bacterium]|uniref:Big-1 domain-containing protein n=1 Tax=Tectimicrobiota bacterium TaxID=2528274 RepID=A0A933GM40_UNCTE|nr:hypothetical protein [Candidatus Tectomicrobia bacterium]
MDKTKGGIYLFSKSLYRSKSAFCVILMGLVTIAGCASLLSNTIKESAGPSSPSGYFLSIEADPKEVGIIAGQTEITVKVWDKEGKPVPGVPIYLYPKFPYAGWLYETTVVTENDGMAKSIFKDTTAYGGSQYVEAKLENLQVMTYITFMPSGGPGIITRQRH